MSIVFIIIVVIVSAWLVWTRKSRRHARQDDARYIAGVLEDEFNHIGDEPQP